MTTVDYSSFICKLIRGESFLNRSDSLCLTFTDDFIDFAQLHGVLPLISSFIENTKLDLPKQIYQTASLTTSAYKLIVQGRQQSCQNFFSRLDDANIPFLLFKGAANAYLLYEKPWQRQHADIDMLIRLSDYEAVINILDKTGFVIDPIRPAKFGPYQTTAKLVQAGKPDVLIDLHWKINNRLLLADKFNFNELWSNALEIKEYGAGVCGLGYEDALLAACIHEAGSLSQERGKLIGLYDVHLLIERIGKQGLQNVLVKAAEKKISNICINHISKAIQALGDEQQKQMFNDVISKRRKTINEPSSQLLKPDRSWLEDQKLDWQAVEGFTGKIEYLICKILRKLSNQ